MISRRIQQRVRQFVTLVMRPLAQLGITPNTLTLLGLLLSIGTGIVVANGYFLVGGLLVLFAGIFDMFDGALARARNASSIFGAFLDSTLDRYSESIILFGLFWYALQAPLLHENLWPFQHEQSWMLASIYIAVVGSLMVSYAKARAEGLGLECRTGLLARPERVVILAIGLLFGVVIWAVLVLAVFSHVTAIERIVHVQRVTRRSGQASALHREDAVKPNTQGNHDAGRRTLAAQTPANVAESPEPVKTSEGSNPSIEPVRTSVPPFNRSVQQE
jgi:CDP-diacylglycerol---glycerol-3-phosphate 3-phosphatidyltransferase